MATRVHRLNVNGEEQEVLAPAHWTCSKAPLQAPTDRHQTRL